MDIKTKVIKVDKILKYLLNYMSFLYKEYGFCFIDSRVSKSFGGDSYLILQNDEFQVRFVSDRSQLFMDFRSRFEEKKNRWYSSDLIVQLLTGKVSDNAVLDDQIPNSIEKHFTEITQLFSLKHFPATVAKLKILEKERSKRLFG